MITWEDAQRAYLEACDRLDEAVPRGDKIEIDRAVDEVSRRLDDWLTAGPAPAVTLAQEVKEIIDLVERLRGGESGLPDSAKLIGALELHLRTIVREGKT
jgi:hypothetical protein